VKAVGLKVEIRSRHRMSTSDLNLSHGVTVFNEIRSVRALPVSNLREITQLGKFITKLWGVEVRGNSAFPYFTVAVNREAI
jgi:hypothetical protein